MVLANIAGLSWKWVFGGAISGIVAYANLPSAWILPQKKATEPYLATAKLRTLPQNVLVQGESVDPRSLWRENGAVVMAVRRPG